MRTGQIKLRFDDLDELERLWTTIPVGERTKIARRYARLLIKAAKVEPPGPEQEVGRHDEQRR